MSLNSETLLSLTVDELLVPIGGVVTIPVSGCSPSACHSGCGSCAPRCPISDVC
jgi:NAD-dependent dihydropyrimidine dehydrogenase PreA subunit